jgi:hypothetical protein
MKEIECKPFKSLDTTHVANKKHVLLGRMEQKRRQLERIDAENLKMLKRIHGASPTYDHQRWRKQREEEEYLISQKSKFPYVMRNPSSDSFNQDISLFHQTTSSAEFKPSSIKLMSKKYARRHVGSPLNSVDAHERSVKQQYAKRYSSYQDSQQ